MNLIEFFRKSFKQSVYILLTSILIAWVFNTLRSDALMLFDDATQSATAELSQVNASDTGIPSISIDRAIEHFNQGTALFVDARLPVDFAAGHIAGAINVSEPRFDEMIGPFLNSTAPETLVITYCDGADCPLSKNLAEKLNLLGFENTVHLPDGWGKWRAYRMPIEKGE